VGRKSLKAFIGRKRKGKLTKGDRILWDLLRLKTVPSARERRNQKVGVLGSHVEGKNFQRRGLKRKDQKGSGKGMEDYASWVAT